MFGRLKGIVLISAFCLVSAVTADDFNGRAVPPPPAPGEGFEGEKKASDETPAPIPETSAKVVEEDDGLYSLSGQAFTDSDKKAEAVADQLDALVKAFDTLTYWDGKCLGGWLTMRGLSRMRDSKVLVMENFAEAYRLGWLNALGIEGEARNEYSLDRIFKSNNLRRGLNWHLKQAAASMRNLPQSKKKWRYDMRLRNTMAMASYFIDQAELALNDARTEVGLASGQFDLDMQSYIADCRAQIRGSIDAHKVFHDALKSEEGYPRGSHSNWFKLAYDGVDQFSTQIGIYTADDNGDLIFYLTPKGKKYVIDPNYKPE